MKDWYQCTGEEVLSRLETARRGLTEAQAQERKKQYGPNALKEAGTKPAWKVFLEQFKDLLVMILIGAALLIEYGHGQYGEHGGDFCRDHPERCAGNRSA